MTAQSQNVRVMTRLCTGPLTPLDAQRELGVMRLGARVYELRRAPYRCVIHTNMVKVPTRHGSARVAEYVLVRRRGRVES